MKPPEEEREMDAIGVLVSAGNIPVPRPPKRVCNASRRLEEMRSSSICESP